VELLLEVSEQLAAELSRVKTSERVSLLHRLAESLVLAICAAAYSKPVSLVTKPVQFVEAHVSACRN
jgi:hypothetical protein